MAAIEMHIRSGYSLYLATARDRMLYLNPGTNYTPWLFLDGASMGSGYSGWQSMIENRMNVPSPVTVTMWGNYSFQTNTGTIYAKFRNDSNATINANVLFVITEDSIYQPTSLGDLWHNHVARAYLPSHSGTPVSIPAGDSFTYSSPFTISPSWNFRLCDIVTMIQNPIQNPGTTREILQGAFKKATTLEFIGVEELTNTFLRNPFHVNISPNPCVNRTNFAFSLPAGQEYNINIFDISGRTVKILHGIASGSKDVVKCDFKDINTGIYFYRFASEGVDVTGKIIVK